MFLIRFCSGTCTKALFLPPTQTPVSHSHKLLVDLGSAKDSHTTHNSKDQERQDLQFNLLIHRFGASVGGGGSRNRLPNLMGYNQALGGVDISERVASVAISPFKGRRPEKKGVKRNDINNFPQIGEFDQVPLPAVFPKNLSFFMLFLL